VRAPPMLACSLHVEGNVCCLLNKISARLGVVHGNSHLQSLLRTCDFSPRHRKQFSKFRHFQRFGTSSVFLFVFFLFLIVLKIQGNG
jgi:hypothetical protein